MVMVMEITIPEIITVSQTVMKMMEKQMEMPMVMKMEEIKMVMVMVTKMKEIGMEM